MLGVYNVGLDETAASLEASITAVCGLKSISCFQVKSRDDEYSAFRVCINEAITEQFINSLKLWSSGIVIKPWTFKPKETAAHAATAAAIVINNAAAESDNNTN